MTDAGASLSGRPEPLPEPLKVMRFFRGKTDAYWEKMLEKLRAEQPKWKAARPPVRAYNNG